MNQFLLLFFLLLSSQLIAQSHCDSLFKNDWEIQDYDAGHTKQKENYVLAHDAMNAGNYAEAIIYLEYLIEYYPCRSGKGIFIQAEKAYKKLEKEAKGEEKINLQNKLLALYDKRILYHGERLKVLQKKGFKAYPYLINRGNARTIISQLDSLYTAVFQEAGTEVKRINLIYYADIISQKYRYGMISENELTTKIEAITHRIDVIILMKRELNEDISKWETTRHVILASIPLIDPITPEYMETVWLSRVRASENDVKLLEKVVAISQKNDVLDNLATKEALIQLAHLNEDVESIISIADEWLQQGKREKARVLYQACLKGSQDEKLKALLMEKIAGI